MSADKRPGIADESRPTIAVLGILFCLSLGACATSASLPSEFSAEDEKTIALVSDTEEDASESGDGTLEESHAADGDVLDATGDWVEIDAGSDGVDTAEGSKSAADGASGAGDEASYEVSVEGETIRVYLLSGSESDGAGTDEEGDRRQLFWEGSYTPALDPSWIEYSWTSERSEGTDMLLDGQTLEFFYTEGALSFTLDIDGTQQEILLVPKN